MLSHERSCNHIVGKVMSSHCNNGRVIALYWRSGDLIDGQWSYCISSHVITLSQRACDRIVLSVGWSYWRSVIIFNISYCTSSHVITLSERACDLMSTVIVRSRSHDDRYQHTRRVSAHWCWWGQIHQQQTHLHGCPLRSCWFSHLKTFRINSSWTFTQ